MEWFVVKNMGYDGLVLFRFGTRAAAQDKYDQIMKEDKEWDERYPHDPSDKGTAVIEGEIAVSDHLDAIAGN